MVMDTHHVCFNCNFVCNLTLHTMIVSSEANVLQFSTINFNIYKVTLSSSETSDFFFLLIMFGLIKSIIKYFKL